MGAETVQLPAPRHDGGGSLERALLHRRSVRQFNQDAIGLAEISQLMWAGQGITDGRGLRTAPSAGALYPLEIYLVAGRVEKLPAGIYHYRAQPHTMVAMAVGDVRNDLCRAALLQKAVSTAPITIAICAIYPRATAKYGERGVQYTHMEAGHAAQNIALQAVALNLGCVVIGAFRDREVHGLLELARSETPLYLIAVGRPR